MTNNHPLFHIAYKLAVEALVMTVPCAILFVLVETVLPGLLSTHVPLLGVLGVVASLAALVIGLGHRIGAVRASATVPAATSRVALGVALAVTALVAVDYARQADIPNLLVLVVTTAVWWATFVLLMRQR